MTDQPEPEPVVKKLSGRIGRYEILRPLAMGGAGMVYLAHDTVFERDAALKVIGAQIGGNTKLIQGFRREFKAVAKITHRNVVRVFDLGIHTNGSPYIVMELLKGQSLKKAMGSPPPMALEQKVSIIVQILDGLAHVHNAGIVHREIKPASIFIDHDSTAKIMDVGVAKLIGTRVSKTGTMVGSVDYMSPEQVKGAPIDARSDLFSVGCMFYELVAGRPPFHSDDPMAVLHGITDEEVNYDLLPAGLLYAWLRLILEKALAKDVNERYQSAHDFAVDVRAYRKAFTVAESIDREVLAIVAHDLRTPLNAIALGSALFDDEGQTEEDKTDVREIIKRAPARMEVLIKDLRAKGMMTDAPRFVNTWFEGEPSLFPLTVGEWYTLRLNIGARRNEMAAISKAFAEPDFGPGVDSLPLTVSFFSEDFEIAHRQLQFVLPRKGDSEVLSNRLKPLHGQECRLEIVVSLSRELEVLQTVEFAVEARVTAATAAATGA